jgi:thiamine-phosphate pyrophosphorylase
MNHAERMWRFYAADLYVVITESFCAGRTCLEVLDEVLAAGVKLVQFREKDWTEERLIEVGREFRRRTIEAEAVLIIDDNVDLAMSLGADGVHLGLDDMPIESARRLGPELIIGASSHNLEEALQAQRAGASYVNIGPIFSTQTKTLDMDSLGPEAISHIAPKLLIPHTCMGGIKAHNVDDVLDHGAEHPAVVTAVTEAKDIQAAVKELRDKILTRKKD